MTAKSALISGCGQYRYDLWRRWDESKPYVAFICLNPSTADAEEDDPTVRRCVAYAKAWGFGAVCILNLFAYRATDPAEMKKAPDPVGEWNNQMIVNTVHRAGLVVAAWGTHGDFDPVRMGVEGATRQDGPRAGVVLGLLRNMRVQAHALKITKQGAPGHPLYLRKDAKPASYSAPNMPPDVVPRGVRVRPPITAPDFVRGDWVGVVWDGA